MVFYRIRTAVDRFLMQETRQHPITVTASEIVLCQIKAVNVGG